MDGFCKPRCEDCCFFQGDPEDDTSGFCHFNPPVIVNGAQGVARVGNDYWCGRWRNIHCEKFALWDVPDDVHRSKSDP